jgi:hypothetical protein
MNYSSGNPVDFGGLGNLIICLIPSSSHSEFLCFKVKFLHIRILSLFTVPCPYMLEALCFIHFDFESQALQNGSSQFSDSNTLPPPPTPSPRAHQTHTPANFFSLPFEPQEIICNPRDMAGRSPHMYDRECVIYLAKSVKIAKAGLARWQAMNMVGDEARCSNLQIMTLFVSVPIASDITHGFVAPHQINPDLHVDLGAHSVSERIGDALKKAADGLPCAKKPEADPLVSTWHVCQCLDNALASTVAVGGLYHFRPTVEMPRLALGEGGGFSRSKAGRWRLSRETSEGPVHQWLLPSPRARK